MLKNKIISTIIYLLILLFPITINAKQGCCSHHGGVAYCGSSGFYMCKDGTRSPSCTCATSGNSNSSSNNNSNNNSSSNSNNSSNKNNTTNSNKTDNSINDETTDDKNNETFESNIIDNNESQNNTTEEEPKSDISTLKSLKINDDYIEVSEKMEYRTTLYTAIIEYEPTDLKSTVSVDKETSLNIGNNEFIITVLAEDGISKTEYTLNIVREEEIINNEEEAIYNNNSINLKVNGKEVIFTNYESNTIYLSADEKLNIVYTLSNPNTKIDLDYKETIESGYHTIKFNLINEDGTKTLYKLNIYKEKEEEPTRFNPIGLLIYGIGVTTIIIIYEKRKKSQNKLN